jgi:pimeloyl-ACP methyl ester carboxylesterase
MRGRVAGEEVGGVVPEYVESARRYLGDAAEDHLAMLKAPGTRMARIARDRPGWDCSTTTAACRCRSDRLVTVERSPVVSVPGAWSRAEVWDTVAARLRAAGRVVHALTLSGLGEGEGPPGDAGPIGLQDHVADVLGFLSAASLHDVVLVGHSYSGLVVGQAADQAPDRVARAVFVQAFLPVTGRSLVDEFGPAAEAEARQIEDHDGWWPPPAVDDLAREPDLDPAAARDLHVRLVPHPGRTVLEPARMTRPHIALDARYVVQAGATLPGDLRLVPPARIHRIEAGHFSMLTAPDRVARTLLAATG